MNKMKNRKVKGCLTSFLPGISPEVSFSLPPGHSFSGPCFFPFSRGFILLELVLALALLSVVLTAAYNFYFLGLVSHRKGTLQAELQQSARISAQRITSELKYARSYQVRSSGRELRFFQEGSTTRYTFRRRGDDLEYLIGTTVTKVACNITHLDFSTGGDGEVIFQVVAGQGDQEYSLVSSVRPRNL